MPVSKNRNRQCQFCNKDYVLMKDSSLHKYCSLRCRQQWHYNRWKSNGGKRCPLKTRSYQLKTHYGITLEEFDQMFAKQNNCCKICKIQNTSGKNWHVDHCHISCKIRGILCSACNQALGLVKENINTLEQMILYLKENTNE